MSVPDPCPSSEWPLRLDVPGNNDWNLFAACWSGDFARIQRTVADGASLTNVHRVPDSKLGEFRECTPLEVAFSRCSEEAVMFLLNRLTIDDHIIHLQRGVSLLCLAITGINRNVILHLLRANNLYIHMRDEYGVTPLFCAVGTLIDGEDIIREIITRDPLQRFILRGPIRGYSSGRSVLHYAVQYGMLNTVHALLQYKDDHLSDFVELQDKDGSTALHLAAESLLVNKVELMQEILLCSDRVAGMVNNSGKTAAELYFNPHDLDWE